MTPLKSLCVVTMFGGVMGCATSVEPDALRSSETPHRVNATVMNLTNTVLELESDNTALRTQVHQLTEMLLDSELSRSRHLVTALDGE